MSKKTDAVLAGTAVGMAIALPAAVAALTAVPNDQTFYLDGGPISLTTYAINGDNYVKLRDIGKAVGFGVTCDASDNSVHIPPDREDDALPANLDIRHEII